MFVISLDKVRYNSLVNSTKEAAITAAVLRLRVFLMRQRSQILQALGKDEICLEVRFESKLKSRLWAESVGVIEGFEGIKKSWTF